MTPTEAYRAALEAAARVCADQFAEHMTAAICGEPENSRGRESAANMAEKLLHAIRALPVPEGLDDICPRCAHAGGLDDTDAGGTKCRFCGWRDDENTVPASGVPKRSFPDAADGSPSLPMEPELWAAGCDLETARFVARQLAAGGYTLTESDELDRLQAKAKLLQDKLDHRTIKYRNLRAENERLRAALEKIAGPGTSYLNDMGEFHRCQDIARDALKGGE